MSDPFVGEIKMLAFNWAPQGWALCDGSLLQVQQNVALFSLLGTTFGGNGTTTFGLPDLRGRTPLGVNQQFNPVYNRGAAGGAETVTLGATQVPGHTHTVTAYAQNGTALGPTGNVISNVVSSKTGTTTNFASYLPATQWTANTQLNTGSVSIAGGSQAHNNMQPFTVVNFCICQVGIFPPRN